MAWRNLLEKDLAIAILQEYEIDVDNNGGLLSCLRI